MNSKIKSIVFGVALIMHPAFLNGMDYFKSAARSAVSKVTPTFLAVSHAVDSGEAERKETADREKIALTKIKMNIIDYCKEIGSLKRAFTDVLEKENKSEELEEIIKEYLPVEERLSYFFCMDLDLYARQLDQCKTMMTSAILAAYGVKKMPTMDEEDIDTWKARIDMLFELLGQRYLGYDEYMAKPKRGRINALKVQYEGATSTEELKSIYKQAHEVIFTIFNDNKSLLRSPQPLTYYEGAIKKLLDKEVRVRGRRKPIEYKKASDVIFLKIGGKDDFLNKKYKDQVKVVIKDKGKTPDCLAKYGSMYKALLIFDLKSISKIVDLLENTRHVWTQIRQVSEKDLYRKFISTEEWSSLQEKAFKALESATCVNGASITVEGLRNARRRLKSDLEDVEYELEKIAENGSVLSEDDATLIKKIKETIDDTYKWGADRKTLDKCLEDLVKLSKKIDKMEIE